MEGARGREGGREGGDAWGARQRGGEKPILPLPVRPVWFEASEREGERERERARERERGREREREREREI